MDIATSREIFSMGERISTATRLLIVDDEPLIRWSLGERLSSAGYEVQQEGDGASALEHFRDGVAPVDLAVLDLKLPDTDGVSLMKKIKQLSPNCRVILMTAFWTSDKLEEARRHGAYAVVPKPFDLDRMVHTIELAMSDKPLGATQSTPTDS